MKPFAAYFFPVAIILLFLLRFLHFGSAIDAPHDWRQSDTAFYIQDFYENGIDVLHPRVCWMGANNTLALECPLPEALIAAAYRVFGPSIPLARLLFLLLFAGAVYFFYKVIALLFGSELARWASLVYMALPLSIYYSRAVHIDFSAIMLSHAMVYYYLLGVHHRRWAFLLLSSVAASLAFVIKAPYAFYFALPMLAYAAHTKSLKWVLQRAWVYALAFGCFWAWQTHATALNSVSPNLDYILHFRKFDNNLSWYFGTLQQRLTAYHWKVLLQRGVLEVCGLGGIFFSLFGFRRLQNLPNVRILLWWIVGLAAYVLIFFNLNVVHNYYQLPLLAPVAVLCARGILSNSGTKQQFAPLLFGLLLTANWLYAEHYYYQIDTDCQEIAQTIRVNTPDTSLVIVSYKDMDCRNPKILYPAQRRGWSVEETALKPLVIERLRDEEQANIWVYIGEKLPSNMKGFTQNLSLPQVFELNGGAEKIFLFDLLKRKQQDLPAH
ncbi:MAG: glycosyltransferase family 39 protein [Lewinellaceae bacterium]|nr:glycosyltransferase family 39 protein [Lewinellaceae bacterium]